MEKKKPATTVQTAMSSADACSIYKRSRRLIWIVPDTLFLLIMGKDAVVLEVEVCP